MEKRTVYFAGGRNCGKTAALRSLESPEQQAVVAWFRLQHPQRTILAIPNGAHLAGDARRRAMKMARMKAEGLEPGAADLFVAVPIFKLLGASSGGLWIEMKALEGKLTPEQSRFGARMGEAGYRWVACFGADEAIEAIKRYMAEHRLAAAAREPHFAQREREQHPSICGVWGAINTCTCGRAARADPVPPAFR